MSTDIDLDTRLRSAGASLHRAVYLIPADTPPQAAPKAPNRFPLLAAAAAVLIVVALAAVALALQEGEPPVSTDPGKVPRLLAEGPVAGLTLTGAADLPLPITDSMTGFRTWFALYQNDAGDQVGILRLDPDAQLPETQDGPNTTVRGHEARVDESGAYGTILAWDETEAFSVSLLSDDLDGDALVAATDDLQVEGDDIRLGGDFAVVAVVPDLSFGMGLAVPGSAVGHIAGYEATDESGAGAYGGTLSAGADDVAVLRWISRADEPIEVRGNDGWIGVTTSEGVRSSGSSDSGESGEDEVTTTEIWTVVWEEGPGTVGVAQVYGLGRDDALALAESLRPVDQATWDQLLTDTDSLVPRDAQASMEADDGSWVVYLDADGYLCSATRASEDTSTSSCSDPATVNVQDGDQRFIYGVLPEGAEGWRDANGDNWFNTDGDGDIAAGLYSFDLGDKPVPDEVVFIDAEGNEVRREPTGGGEPVTE